MALKDLDTFFDPDLHLPIRGKTYRIAAPDGEEGPRLRQVITDDGLPAPAQTDEAIKVLGDAFDEMVVDKVPWPMILHAGRTALLHFGFTPDMAEIHWGMAHLGRMVDLEKVTELLATNKKT